VRRRLAATCAVALGLSACANVVAERDRLAERVQELEAQSRALEGERDRLSEQLEDLRQERDRLAHEVDELGQAQRQSTARQQDLEEKAALAANQQALIQELEAGLAASESQNAQLREGVSLTLSTDALFAPASVDLTREGRALVKRIAGDLRDKPDRIEVQGHTDATTAKGALAARYPTNWELAGARAARVVRELAADGVDPARLAAVSLGDRRPVASNDTAVGRAQNRRIEIRLVPPAGAPAAPAAQGAAPAPQPAAPPPGPTGAQ